MYTCARLIPGSTRTMLCCKYHPKTLLFCELLALTRWPHIFLYFSLTECQKSCSHPMTPHFLSLCSHRMPQPVGGLALHPYPLHIWLPPPPPGAIHYWLSLAASEITIEMIRKYLHSFLNHAFILLVVCLANEFLTVITRETSRSNNTHAYTNQSFAKQLLKESEVNFNWTLAASR